MATLNTQQHSPATGAAGSMLAMKDREPWDFYDDLRAKGGIVWDPDYGAWLVASYDFAKQVARDDKKFWDLSFRVDPSRPAPLGMSDDDWVRFFGYGSKRFLAMTDDEDHTRQHKWQMRALSPRVLEGWRETLFRPISHGLIDRFIDRGHAEVGNEFADLLAPRVIAAVLGFPWEDDDWIEHVGNLVLEKVRLKQLTGMGAADPALVKRAMEASDEIIEVLLPYIRARKNGDGDDLISMVWRDVEGVFGPDWEEIDLIGMVGGIWEGGSHSTRNSTANGLYMLLSDEDLQRKVREGDDEVLANFIEESLRLYGPVLFRPRIAKEDVQLGDVTVRAGETALVLMTSGGRDPEHYGCPHMVDTSRPAPRDHLSFYFGPHTCPGGALARAELQEATRILLDRLPDLRFDPDAEKPVFEGLLVRRWHPLNVVFTPGEKRG
jgi:cytochrome P450